MNPVNWCGQEKINQSKRREYFGDGDFRLVLLAGRKSKEVQAII